MAGAIRAGVDESERDRVTYWAPSALRDARVAGSLPFDPCNGSSRQRSLTCWSCRMSNAAATGT